jgi:hypothetical protein
MRAPGGLTATRRSGDAGDGRRAVALVSGVRVYQTLAAAGFESLWYWVLQVVVWTLACYRTLGVPQDMLVRAGRSPEIAARVEALAHLSAERIAGIYDDAGVPLAAVAGFVLATLAALGFLSGLEVAQAAFALLLPLAAIVYSKLRLALFLRRRPVTGSRLVLILSRRRLWHQVIAVSAMLGAVALAHLLRPLAP